MPDLTFDQWLTELNKLAEAEGCRDYVGQTGREAWEDGFNDGMSPEETWAEEKAAGAHIAGDGGK